MKFLGVRGGHGYTAPECARAQGQRLPIPVTRGRRCGRPTWTPTGRGAP